MERSLPEGWDVYEDDDGDWWLRPPPHITIVSKPGEAYLLPSPSGEVAVFDSQDLIRQWGCI